MREKRMRRVLVWFLLLALVLGQGNMAFAAKPVRPAPEPSSTLDITTGDLTLTVQEDQAINFTVNASTKEEYAIIWGTTTSDYGLLSLTDKTSPIAKPGKKVTAYLQDATFLFEPSDVDSDQTAVFTITAVKPDDSINKDQITVTITVTPVEIQINTPPDAVNDQAQGVVGELLLIEPLLNDFDKDGDTISLVSVQIIEGSEAIGLTIDGDNIIITPTEPGTITVQYAISDGKITSVGIIVIVVNDIDSSIVYLALGDSIPYGKYYTDIADYLFFGGTDTTSYIEQFAAEFNVSNSDYDQSISGLNTVDIYNKLTPDEVGYDPILENQVRQADVITLCIGANDIMDAVPRSFYGLEKYNIDWAIADSGRQNFEIYWQQVIDRIHELNNDVTLVVMTVYNPYHNNESIYMQVDEYFSSDVDGDYGLNYIIKNTMSLYGAEYSNKFTYLVADVYYEFNKVTNKDSLTGFYSYFSDPHPNQLGQNLIYNTHLKLFY
ncbi:MAG: hypothetical protein K8R73_07700 [Clostridiales bacterium]|nr:hypothetical protein [Clostridiales bacterium]